MRHWKIDTLVVILDPQPCQSTALNEIRQKYGPRNIEHILMASRSLEGKPPYHMKFIFSESKFDRKKTMAAEPFMRWRKMCPSVEFVQYHVNANSQKLKIRVHKEGDLMLLRMMKS